MTSDSQTLDTSDSELSFEMKGPSKQEGLPGAHFEVPPRLTSQFLLKIVKGETPDDWLNELVYPLLGWFREEDGTWNNDLVDDKWKAIYTDGPPNFIGTAGNYSPEVDRPIRNANQNLIRSTPLEHKQVVKQVLRPLGFKGWKANELTPNRTRRTALVNWIIYWYKVHYPDYQW